MKRGSKHQLNRKTLLFIAIFSIALFVFPQKIFAVESYLIDESISWRYKLGHLYLDFTSDVTTDEMEIEPNNWNSLWTGGNSNMDGKLEADFSVLKGVAYSKPIIWVKCDDYAPVIENAEGVTPAQILTLDCVTEPFTGDGSHYVDFIEYDFLQDLNVWVGESLLLSRPWVFYYETLITPTLEATFPPTGTTTAMALGSFSATGIWETGSLDWTFLEIQFSTSTTSTIYSFNIDILGETSGSYDIPVDLWYAGTYDVKYVFTGYGGLWGVVVLYYEFPIATTTLIVSEGTSQDWYDFIQPDLFEEEEPEEGTIQHYLWSIKKFFRGLILPSREMKIRLVNTLFKIKTLFPYNYISLTKDWFVDVEAGIEQDPTLEISLFGAEVETIPFSFWEANITIGSQTKPLFGWVTIIITYILWYGFLMFIINFIKRIF